MHQGRDGSRKFETENDRMVIGSQRSVKGVLTGQGLEVCMTCTSIDEGLLQGRFVVDMGHVVIVFKVLSMLYFCPLFNGITYFHLHSLI